jgi:signal transduction histidine kinase
MSRPIQFNNHPFKFLLYLEWILLALAISTSMLPEHSPRLASKFPELTIGCLIIFGLMGLRLPTSNHRNQIIYTAIEVLLLLLIGTFGGKTARLFPFLYLILVTRSCLIFQLYGRLVVTGMSFALFLITLNARSPRRLQPQDIEKFRFFTFNTSLLFGLSLLFVLLLMNTVLSERKSREKLAIANEKLRQYALRIENQATLEERNRIAREIHDSLGHSLTALNLQLETALKLWQSNPPKAQVFLARAKELGSKALKDVRQSVSTMRANPLQEKTLEQAIAILLEDFYRATNIKPISLINLENPPSTEINVAVYRIIQESLTNISKYANATEVILKMAANRNSLCLMIQDNGRGFDIQQNTTGFGLQSMRDRTLALGGEFNINSTPGSGCQIIVELPLPRFIK